MNNEHYKNTVEKSMLTRADIHMLLAACTVIRNSIETNRVFASSGGICFHLTELTNTNALRSPMLTAFRVFAETWEHYVNPSYMVPAPKDYANVTPVCTEMFAAANYYTENNYINNPDEYKNVFWYEGEYAESRKDLLEHVIREVTEYLDYTASAHQKLNFEITQKYTRLYCVIQLIRKYSLENRMPIFAATGICCLVNKLARTRSQFDAICAEWPSSEGIAYVVPSGVPGISAADAYRNKKFDDDRVDYMWHEGTYAENRMELIDFSIEWLDNNSTQLVY